MLSESDNAAKDKNVDCEGGREVNKSDFSGGVF